VSDIGETVRRESHLARFDAAWRDDTTLGKDERVQVLTVFMLAFEKVGNMSAVRLARYIQHKINQINAA
jgi:hypothetical protein